MSVALVVPKMLPLEIKNNNPKKKCIASNKKKFESIIFTFFGIDDAENRQQATRSFRALDKTYTTNKKKTLQRVPVWYRLNILQMLS